ncbi:MAG: hypothetical protein QW040_00590 [Candidatus Aenigmatarchaeota archaeon]
MATIIKTSKKIKKVYRDKGINEKMLESVEKALYSIDGENYRSKILKITDVLKRRFEKNVIDEEKLYVEFLKISYGENWQAVSKGLRQYGKGFSLINKDDLPIFLNVLSDEIGYWGIEIASLLTYGPLDILEIAKTFNVKVDKVRRILHKLVSIGVVAYKSKGIHEIYSLNELNFKHLIEKQKKKIVERINNFIEEEENLNVVCNCGFRTTFEEAIDMGFRCLNCKRIMDLKKNHQILDTDVVLAM